jgi:hypothetical protein
MNITSVLNRADPNMVNKMPYPHIVMDNALPSDLYEALSDEYPTDELFSRGKTVSNRACLYKSSDALKRGVVSETWRSFIAYHTSARFYADFLHTFGAYVAKLYPAVASAKTPVGVRGIDTHKGCDVLMDAPMGINTPVVGVATSVRGPHLDAPNKLYNGLLYFRHPEDSAEGGEFTIYEKDGSKLIERTRVPYMPNVLVFFVNVPQAVHGVSIRTAGPFSRRYVSFNGECSKPLFREQGGP